MPLQYRRRSEVEEQVQPLTKSEQIAQYITTREEQLSDILDELLSFWYMNRNLTPRTAKLLADLLWRASEQNRLTVTPDELAIVLAAVPPLVPTYIVGPPGGGKTSSLVRIPIRLAELLDRELIDVRQYVRNLRDFEELYNEVYKNPQKYVLYSYITGGQITREYYALPILTHVPARELAEARNIVQSWILPPEIAIHVPPREAIREALQELEEEYSTRGGNLRELEMSLLYGEPASRNIISKLVEKLPIGFLVIDEALQAFPEFVEQYIMALTGQRTWQSQQLNPLTRLILIWNPPEYNEAVRRAPIPTYRRGFIIEVTVPTPEQVWNYAAVKYYKETGRELPFELYLLYRAVTASGRTISPTEQMMIAAEQSTPFTTPAGLVRWLLTLADYYYALNLPPEEKIPVIYRIGLGIAKGLLAPTDIERLRLYVEHEVPKPEEILEEPSKWLETLRNAEAKGIEPIIRSRMLLELGYYLANKLTPENISKLVQLIREGKLDELDLELLLTSLANALYSELRDKEKLINSLVHIYDKILDYVYKIENMEEKKTLLKKLRTAFVKVLSTIG
ncbi:MAG: hypothetical protein GXO26_01795 [Crenarchaeota archaeon]|nr:hypothetical protein [Thermoproteota archaeon]